MMRHTGPPLVSVILTTRDRPRLFSLALACYRQQTYSPRELIVVDDGAAYPADENAVAAAGGRVIRMPEGTPLGIKLNAGAASARGLLCQKMDDDDWYASRFLETMVGAWAAERRDACVPTLTYITGFLFFDLVHWEVRESVPRNIPGATLLFARDDWEERPFRALFNHEDVWYLLDQVRIGTRTLEVHNLDIFLAVRHGGMGSERGHTWTHQADGRLLEEYMSDRPLHHRQPADLLPEWALAIYRRLHEESVGASA